MVKAMLTRYKQKLSTLNRGSWHARLTFFALGNRSRKTKACPYWWVVVPASLPIAGLKLLFLLLMGAVLAVLLCILELGYPIVGAGAWFCGYRPYCWMFHNEVRRGDPPEGETYKVFMPYKVKSDGPTPQRVRVAPYQVATPLLIVAAIALGIQQGVLDSGAHEAGSFVGTNFTVVLWVLVGIVSVCALGYLYRFVASPWLKARYERWCPPIVWVGDDPTQAAKASEA